MKNNIVIDSLKFNISRKERIVKFIYGMNVNIKVFHKFIP